MKILDSDLAQNIRRQPLAPVVNMHCGKLLTVRLRVLFNPSKTD
jgi:hypothetical protein